MSVRTGSKAVMAVHPVELKRLESKQVAIVWSDGLEHQLTYRLLRDHCPCANCRTTDDEAPDSAGLRVLSPAETIPLDIVSMSPVGNYAYHIQFSDGHNTGIYSFDLLRSLANQ